MLLKLYALPCLYKEGNFARVGINENDIATLFHYYQPDTAALLTEISKYVTLTWLGRLGPMAALLLVGATILFGFRSLGPGAGGARKRYS